MCQSDEVDTDVSSNTDNRYYKEPDAGAKDLSEEDSGDSYSDADVDRQLDSVADRSWWQQLGPRTRGAPRVDYCENKVTELDSPESQFSTKVCLSPRDASQSLSNMLATVRKRKSHDLMRRYRGVALRLIACSQRQLKRTIFRGLFQH